MKGEGAVLRKEGALPGCEERIPGTPPVFTGGDFPALEELCPPPRPLEVEIGCGKGKFLLARAAEAASVFLIGVDYSWKWMKVGVERAAKRGLSNVAFYRGEAGEFVKNRIPAGRVSVFHVYFPDPWPKRRHRKRRLVKGPFLALLFERLAPGGLVELATDDFDYFIQMKQAAIESGAGWAEERESAGERLFPGGVETSYETKYAARGRKIYYYELRR